MVHDFERAGLQKDSNVYQEFPLISTDLLPYFPMSESGSKARMGWSGGPHTTLMDNGWLSELLLFGCRSRLPRSRIAGASWLSGSALCYRQIEQSRWGCNSAHQRAKYPIETDFNLNPPPLSPRLCFAHVKRSRLHHCTSFASSRGLKLADESFRQST